MRDLEFVQDAIASIRKTATDLDGNVEMKIVMTYQAHDKLQRSNNEIRDKLSARLPSYMLPDQYYVVDEFPLNKNGKLDLSALE